MAATRPRALLLADSPPMVAVAQMPLEPCPPTSPKAKAASPKAFLAFCSAIGLFALAITCMIVCVYVCACVFVMKQGNMLRDRPARRLAVPPLSIPSASPRASTKQSRRRKSTPPKANRRPSTLRASHGSKSSHSSRVVWHEQGWDNSPRVSEPHCSSVVSITDRGSLRSSSFRDADGCSHGHFLYVRRRRDPMPPPMR